MFFSLIVFIMLYHPAQWRSVCQLNMSAKAIRSSSILLKEDFSFFRQWRGLLFHFLSPYPFSLCPRGQTLRHWRANQRPPTLMSHPKTSLPSLRLTVSFIFGPCKHVLTVFPLEIHLLSIVYSPPVGLTFEWVVRSCSSLFCTLGVVVFCRQYGNELSNCKLFFMTHFMTHCHDRPIQLALSQVFFFAVFSAAGILEVASLPPFGSHPCQRTVIWQWNDGSKQHPSVG